ncbi:MAG: PAS domain-containing sensor histidine kinase [Chloroflexota bacterium]
MTSTDSLSQETLALLQKRAKQQGLSTDAVLRRLLSSAKPVNPLYRAIYEQANDAIVVINRQQEYVNVNQAACDLFGYSRQEFLNLTVFDLIAEEDSRREQIVSLWKQNGFMNTVYRLRKSDGKIIYVDISAVADVIENHDVAIMRDVTENITTLDNLISSQIALESIFEKADTPFFSINIISEERVAIEGIDDEVLALPLTQNSSTTNAPDDEQLFAHYGDLIQYMGLKCFETGRVLQFEAHISAEDDEQNQLWLTRLTPVRNQHGEIERLLGVYTELFDQSSAEVQQRETFELYQELTHAHALNRYKAEITAMIAHEFQTPLSIIGTSTYMLRKMVALLDQVKAEQRLSRIDTQVERLKELMYRVIDLNYSTVMQQDLELSVIHIEDFIADVVSELRDAFVEAMPITVDYNIDNPNITTDSELMRQIISNIVSNAIKYSASKRLPVHITCEEKVHTFELVVKDQGIGIPKADLETIFDFFQRGRNASNHQGIGIGLMIVKQSVMRLGGTVAINSVEGQGTTVMVRFPKNASQSEAATA